MAYEKKKPFFPKTYSDLFATTFLFLTIFLITWYQLLILHHWRMGFIHFLTHVFTGAYILGSIISNLIFLMRKDSTAKQVKLSVVAAFKKERFCPDCKIYIPPRAHHCDVCKVCILKRDHHCTFTSCCIGFYNHRYFYYLLLYLWIGIVYVLFCELMSGSMWEKLGGFGFKTALHHLFPLLFWYLGSISFSQLYSCSLVLMMIVLLIYLSILINYYTALMIRGQTVYENNRNETRYNIGFDMNVITVLGFNWKAAFFWSFSPLVLPGNGTYFYTKDNWNPKYLLTFRYE